MSILNIPDIERYLQFLDSAKEVFCYAFFDEHSKEVIKGHGIKYGLINEIVNDCQQFAINNAFTLHVTLNRMKLTGRKRKDAEAARVLCVDFDRCQDSSQVKELRAIHRPHLIVESSPYKFHFYWKIDTAIDIPAWSRLQLGLNDYFDADLNLAQPNHTIRVPGVSRVTKDGQVFMPKIVFQTDALEVLGYAQVLEQFPWVLEQADKASTKQKQTTRMIGSFAKNIGKGRFLDYGGLVKDVGANNRNDTLYSLLYSFASDISEDITEPALCQIAQDYNAALVNHPKGQLEQSEIDKTIKSAFEHGIEKRQARIEGKERKEKELERMLEQSVSVNGHGESHNRFEYDYSSGEIANNRFSDVAATEMVLQKFKHHLVKIGKTVYGFDENAKVWRNQKGLPDIVQEFVTECLSDMAKDPQLIVELCTNDNGDISPAKIRRERARLSSIRLINQVVGYVLNSSDIRRVNFSDFDTNPYLFYAANGVLNLLTDEIRPAQATDMLLRQASVEYNRDARCPYFEKFIGEIYRDNQAPSEVIRFIQELFGYSLTGDTEEQTVFIHTGDGANGKSRLLGALASLLGDYSTRLDPQALTKNKNSMEREVGRIGVKFEAKRVMIIDDLDTKSQWNDNLVKTLTDSTIQARKLYEEERDIPNRAKIHIGCNQTPNIENGGKAMDRRICIIEYPREFEPSPAKYKEIVESINRELSGILNWAIEGLKRIQSYSDKKTKWPDEVYVRVEEYQEANAPAQIDLEMLFEASLDEADAHTLDEIIMHVKNRCFKMGIPDTFSKERIGILLRKNGFEKKRIRKNSVLTTFYFLKFKENSLSDFLAPT